MYRTLEAGFRDGCVAFMGLEGVLPRMSNDVDCRFEAPDATALPGGTETLSRCVGVKGANQIVGMRPGPALGVGARVWFAGR